MLCVVVMKIVKTLSLQKTYAENITSKRKQRKKGSKAKPFASADAGEKLYLRINFYGVIIHGCLLPKNKLAEGG